jgi:hypothetical protein
MPYTVWEEAPNGGLHCHKTSTVEWNYQPCLTLTTPLLPCNLKIDGTQSRHVKRGQTLEHDRPLQYTAQVRRCD